MKKTIFFVINALILTARGGGSDASKSKSDKFDTVYSFQHGDLNLKDSTYWTMASDARYADSFGLTMKYWPNRDEMPDLVSEFIYPTPRTGAC